MAVKQAEDKNASVASEKQKALDAALAQIEKQFGKGAVMRLGQHSTLNVEAIPTGSLSLDIALGIGGVPKGRIIEIYGPESSGKTTVALHIVAECQKRGGSAVFIDVEHALDPNYAKALGVDIDSLLVSQPDTGEQALEIGLGGSDGHQGRDRGRDGRQPCGCPGPSDVPGSAQAHRRHRQIQLCCHLHQPAA